MISSNKIDEGDIVYQRNFIFPHSLKKPIDYFLFQIEKKKKFLIEFIDKLKENNDFPTIGQPEYLSSYYPRLNTEKNGWIDWSLKNIDLFNFICAFDDPYLGASTMYQKNIVRIKSVTWTRSEHNFHPYQHGLIYRKIDEYILVAINGGSLIIEKVINNKNKNILKIL